MPYIVVDAGHGGYDNGAQFFGQREKDINLRVARKVAARLRQIGFDVTELRTDDTFVGNAAERGRKVAQLKPDFAISIHVNSSGGHGVLSGAEIIVPLGEDTARFEFNLREQFEKLNRFRSIYSRVSRTSTIYERQINPQTMRYTTTYPQLTDYYGIIREAWNGGVSLDIIEMFYLDNEGDLYTFLNQEDRYVEAIVYSLSQAFGMEYRHMNQPQYSFTPTQSESREQTQTYYRVVCGSYTDLNEARRVQQHLSGQQYQNVWIQPVEVEK